MGSLRDLPRTVAPASRRLSRFDQVLDAIAREKQLKGWRRSKKIALIQSRNPQWQDLAEKWGWQMAFPGESITGR
jgi:putative endonuclease